MKKLLLIILTLIISHQAFSQIIYDFGDAPEIYGSADHIIDGTNRFLGSKPDAETSQQYSPEADGDDLRGTDDEDGVTFPDMIQGTTGDCQDRYCRIRSFERLDRLERRRRL